MIRSIANELADLIEKKNLQYGNSYDRTREEYGEIIFLVRITDKLNRLKALCSKGLSSEIDANRVYIFQEKEPFEFPRGKAESLKEEAEKLGGR